MRWESHGPLLALTGFLLALAALGWDPALRVLSGPQDTDRFAFRPRLIRPSTLLAALLLGGGATTALAFELGLPWLLVATPALLVALQRALLAVAAMRYRSRLRAQVLTAVTQLAALTSGSAAILHAFRTVGARSPWPLSEEWGWVDQHINLAYEVDVGGGRETRYSDHAYALRRLAEQTPLEVHARVLDHLASVYEQGAEGGASARLRQLADVLGRQLSLQRELATALGRVRGEATIISGAMALIAIWLAFSQPARLHAAFFESPLGPFAAAWFLLWLVAPIAIAEVVARPPDLPL